MSVRAATPADLAAVQALLRREGLPDAGVAEHFEYFSVAEVDGVLVGSSGLELYGSCALLRSVVVAPAARGTGTGIGAALVRAALAAARARGAERIFLLTTTAADYFRRFGFSRLARTEVPDAVQRSREFRELCPASATVMGRSTS